MNLPEFLFHIHFPIGLTGRVGYNVKIKTRIHVMVMMYVSPLYVDLGS